MKPIRFKLCLCTNVEIHQNSNFWHIGNVFENLQKFCHFSLVDNYVLNIYMSQLLLLENLMQKGLQALNRVSHTSNTDAVLYISE